MEAQAPIGSRSTLQLVKSERGRSDRANEGVPRREDRDQRSLLAGVGLGG